MGYLINKIVGEALAYDSLDQMEKYIDKKDGLKNMPIQPLYLALRKLPLDKVTMAIEKMTPEQRCLVLDLELWQKDHIDIENFENWMLIYARSPNDKLRFEFSTGQHFQFYLKSKFNIWTFDVEEPLYPDHDNYFLTDDNLLLFEFDEDTPNIDEVRLLIRELYYEWGVERAYAHLFKMVSESYLHLEEEEFQDKKSRLEDFGLVDYYDALEFKNCFPTVSHLEHFIKNKKSQTAEIDIVSKGQALHNNSVIAFRDGVEGLEEELSKIKNEKRREFLHFNFLRLVNGTISLDGALREGVISMTRTGKKTKSLLLLGFDYIKNYINNEVLLVGENLFDFFNFADIFKVGNTLIKVEQKGIKKSMSYFINNKEAEKFLGSVLTDFLDFSLESPAVLHFNCKDIPIETFESYKSFSFVSKGVADFSPFIIQFHKTFELLKTEGKLQDYFYLNYNIEDIDFESILLTSFCNFILDQNIEKEAPKMGISILEFKKFAEKYISAEGVLDQLESLKVDIRNFSLQYGMDKIEILEEYLILLIKQEMEGYRFENLDPAEFKFIGGPIILA